MVIFCQDDIILSQGEQFCAGVTRKMSVKVISNQLKQRDNSIAAGWFLARGIGQAQPLHDGSVMKGLFVDFSQG